MSAREQLPPSNSDFLAGEPMPRDPRDPWRDTPQPPGSKEAAVIASRMKREQDQPKRKGKRV